MTTDLVVISLALLKVNASTYFLLRFSSFEKSPLYISQYHHCYKISLKCSSALAQHCDSTIVTETLGNCIEQILFTNLCCPWEICYRSLDGWLIGIFASALFGSYCEWRITEEKKKKKKRYAEHHSLLSKTLFANPLGCQNSIQMLLQPLQIFIHMSQCRETQAEYIAAITRHICSSLSSIWKFFSYSVFVCILQTGFGKINTIRDQINTLFKCTAFCLFDGMYCQAGARGIHTLLPILNFTS